MRKINPAFAGKCIAVAVACVWLAAEPKMAWRRASFPTKHRAEHACEHYWRNNCEICIRHCQGFEKSTNLGGKGGGFRSGRYHPFLLPLFPLLGAGLLLRWVEAAGTVGSWPPRASHRASAAFILAAAVSWVPAPTASLMDGGRRQAGKGIGIFEFSGFDSCLCKLGFDEAEPNVRFLLIVRTKRNLSSCCCSDRVGQVLMSHVCKFGKSWLSPKIWWALVPRKIGIGSHCRAKERTNWWRCGKFGTEQKSKCRLECDTHKNWVTNRVKITRYQICELGCSAARGW